MFPRRFLAVVLIVLLTSTYSNAFLITVHRDITKAGLTSISLQYSLLPAMTSALNGRWFTDTAIREIINADMSRDTLDCANNQMSDYVPAVPCGVPTNLDGDYSSLWGELYAGATSSEETFPPDHFDDELFREGNDQIIRARAVAFRT